MQTTAAKLKNTSFLAGRTYQQKDGILIRITASSDNFKRCSFEVVDDDGQYLGGGGHFGMNHRLSMRPFKVGMHLKCDCGWSGRYSQLAKRNESYVMGEHFKCPDCSVPLSQLSVISGKVLDLITNV